MHKVFYSTDQFIDLYSDRKQIKISHLREFQLSFPFHPCSDLPFLTRHTPRIIQSSVVPISLFIFSPVCANFRCTKLLLLFPHCTVSLHPVSLFETNTKSEQQTPPPGFPLFHQFFLTRTKAKSRNLSAVGGGKRAAPADTCRICVSHLLIYSPTSCLSAVCRGHAEVALACTSGCLRWSRSTTSAMTTTTTVKKTMTEATEMTKMKGDMVRHGLANGAPACNYLFFPGVSVLPAAFAEIWKHFPPVFLAALR